MARLITFAAVLLCLLALSYGAVLPADFVQTRTVAEAPAPAHPSYHVAVQQAQAHPLPAAVTSYHALPTITTQTGIKQHVRYDPIVKYGYVVRF